MCAQILYKKMVHSKPSILSQDVYTANRNSRWDALSESLSRCFLETALLDSSQWDYAEVVVRKFHEMNSDPGHRFVRWCFHRACRVGNHQIAALTLSWGVDRDEPGDDGLTPMAAAIEANSYLTVLELVRYGAQLDFLPGNNAPLHLAVSRGYSKRKSDRENAQNITDLRIVILLAERCLNIQAEGLFGFTPLSMAILSLRHIFVMHLVRRGAEVNARDTVLRLTPLMYAAIKGVVRTAEYLIKHKADLNAVNALGHTPLHYAVSEGHFHMAEYLLSQGAIADWKIHRGGETALIVATKLGRADLVSLLIRYGAKADDALSGQSAESAINVARRLGNDSIIDILLTECQTKFCCPFDLEDTFLNF